MTEPLAPTPDETDDTRSVEAQMARRRATVADLRAQGIEPFAHAFAPSHTVGQVRQQWGDVEPGVETGQEVTIGGRLVARRGQGKLAFGSLLEDGQEIQLFVQVNALGEEGMAMFVETLDVGDWIGVTGEVMASRRGELSVRPREIRLLSKALRPLPDADKAFDDIESRSRQREVDLVVNAATREVFRLRSRVLTAIRAELAERDFVEVETPMLHPIPGGASARPFVTHHNALDIDLYLRIAPELYLKRLIAGGIPRVYEINRSFRNEGISPRHNPEFTMLETYETWADHDGVMALTEALVVRAAMVATGGTDVSYQGRDVSLSAPFARRPMLDLAREGTGRADLDYDTPIDQLRDLARTHDLEPDDAWGPGKLVMELFEATMETSLWEPTFVTEHPVEVSPLARRHRDPAKPHVTERFELYITGREMANGFTELIDPDDQRARFEAQADARDAGDDEAMHVDEAYLRAMEIGLPPTGGLGVGIDRLVMLLADVGNIREVLLFPTLRPEA